MATEDPLDQTARLIMRLNAKIALKATCSTCGEDGWDYGTATLFLRQAGFGGDPADLGLEVFPLICANCGYLRLYSVRELEAEPDEESH